MTSKDGLTLFSPAKINLFLHVNGRRDDGYHPLDSWVGFSPDIGDEVTFEPAPYHTLEIKGRYAAELQGHDNLILEILNRYAPDHGFSVTLHKNLPVAAGLGGGSGNAAATLRALAHFNATPKDIHSAAFAQEIAKIGADIPVCIANRSCRIGGIGETITPAPQIPRSAIVLINPHQSCPTPRIFKSLNPLPMAKKVNIPVGFEDTAHLVSFLKEQRNHLTQAAIAHVPAVADILHTLDAQDHCMMARMCGSGATCMGIFKDQQSAQDAARSIAMQHSSWWVKAGTLAGE